MSVGGGAPSGHPHLITCLFSRACHGTSIVELDRGYYGEKNSRVINNTLIKCISLVDTPNGLSRLGDMTLKLEVEIPAPSFNFVTAFLFQAFQRELHHSIDQGIESKTKFVRSNHNSVKLYK